MKVKTIVTVALLAFVGVSVIYLILKETGGNSTAQVPSASAVNNNPEKMQNEQNKVFAYYFHGNRRCVTCRKIEAYTKEAIETKYADALKSGSLEFRIINIEEPENEHFVEDYNLTTRSVVLAKFVNGEEQRWKNLEEVWEFVDDKNAFLQYIENETRDFLEARK